MAFEEEEVIELSDSEPENDIDRRAVLEPVITRVVEALGGMENGQYRLGDEVLGCLKDLKQLWRKDDADDERTVARIFWETRVLPNDLVPILLATAGNGLVDDKRAISCADLMTAMTWPIDMSEELKELDDELDKGADYTQLIQSHLHYKAALLKPGVIQALFAIVLPPLSKPYRERVLRESQIVNLVLHLIRNLAFIKDLPPNTHLSAERDEFSSLQSQLIRSLSETHTLRLLLTIAANTTNDLHFTGWNTLVLEIFYLLFRGVKPDSLAVDETKQPSGNLQNLLAAESKGKYDQAKKAASRHSRFGTTIAVKLNPNKTKRPHAEKDTGNDADTEQSAKPTKQFILHRQQGLNQNIGDIWDISKRQKTKKMMTLDELARQDNLSLEARSILRTLAMDFVENCFNPFLSSVIKDIRSERPKIVQKDHVRLLYVAKWFLSFFLLMREKETAKKQPVKRWEFGLIAEVVERYWIIWILKRMRGAVEEKPKHWTEFQAGIECLTQLLSLIDAMSSTDISDLGLREASEILQQQLIYNGEVLDITLDSLRVYKEGTQSLAYLESSVQMAYVLLRMLERWSKGKNLYRRKTGKRRKRKGEDDSIIQDFGLDEDEDDQITYESKFTFETFEAKFANAEVTHTLLLYLSSYREFRTSNCMKRVVNLMHRQAVRAKAEGLFFKVSTLNQFHVLLEDQKSFPPEQPYKDLLNLINYVLRQFFKAMGENPFLAVEAFFPKNRGHWKQFSTWEPEKSSSKREKTVQDTRFQPDVKVKKGYSWSEELGIVIAALVESGKKELVDWVVQLLTETINQRERIIQETDAKKTDDADESDDEEALKRLQQPSPEAIAAFVDYLVPYVEDAHALEATKNPHLKLLLRLSKFYILDEDADEFEWYIPAAILPSDLRGVRTVITQYLETPFDLQGKKVNQFLSKKTRRRRRVRSKESDEEDAAASSDDEVRKKKRIAKKKKEQEQYKSAQFIEDSDEEYGNMDEFLEQERMRREKGGGTVEGPGRPNMKPTGTKKRRKKGAEGGHRKKRRGNNSPLPVSELLPHSSASESEHEVEKAPPIADAAAPSDASDSEVISVKKKKKRLVLSDEE